MKGLQISLQALHRLFQILHLFPRLRIQLVHLLGTRHLQDGPLQCNERILNLYLLDHSSKNRTVLTNKADIYPQTPYSIQLAFLFTTLSKELVFNQDSLLARYTMKIL